jgi:hypothetical protein
MRTLGVSDVKDQDTLWHALASETVASGLTGGADDDLPANGQRKRPLDRSSGRFFSVITGLAARFYSAAIASGSGAGATAPPARFRST